MSITTPDFEFVRNLVRNRAAIVLDDQKAYLAENRLAPLARSEGFRSVDELVTRLRSAPNTPLHDKVVEALTTNETYFFRDIHPFEMMRTGILPQILKVKAAEKELTIWSAASSTGQEPYSVALLLREHFPEVVSGWKVNIIATDIAAGILARAREGVYSQLEVNRGLPARMLVRYFEKVGNDWVVRHEIRKMVDFRLMNLIGPWPIFPPIDLVMIRNVLIYFDVPTRKEILRKARRCMHPAGFLMLGGSETTLTIDDAFERVEMPPSTCYRLKK